MAKNNLLKRFATSARAEVAQLALQIAECPPLHRRSGKGKGAYQGEVESILNEIYPSSSELAEAELSASGSGFDATMCGVQSK